MGRVNDELRDAVDEAVRATAHNSKLRLSVALSYGARQDIVAATRLLATKAGYGSGDGARGGGEEVHSNGVFFWTVGTSPPLEIALPMRGGKNKK